MSTERVAGSQGEWTWGVDGISQELDTLALRLAHWPSLLLHWPLGKSTVLPVYVCVCVCVFVCDLVNTASCQWCFRAPSIWPVSTSTTHRSTTASAYDAVFHLGEEMFLEISRGLTCPHTHTHTHTHTWTEYTWATEPGTVCAIVSFHPDTASCRRLSKYELRPLKKKKKKKRWLNWHTLCFISSNVCSHAGNTWSFLGVKINHPESHLTLFNVLCKHVFIIYDSNAH